MKKSENCLLLILKAHRYQWTKTSWFHKNCQRPVSGSQYLVSMCFWRTSLCHLSWEMQCGCLSVCNGTTLLAIKPPVFPVHSCQQSGEEVVCDFSFLWETFHDWILWLGSVAGSQATEKISLTSVQTWWLCLCTQTFFMSTFPNSLMFFLMHMALRCQQSAKSWRLGQGNFG